MSDDLLERATAALRDATGTPPDESARQRAKLLAQAAKRTKPTPIWQWAAVAFGGLFVSSAMAQLGGYMPMIMRALTRDDAPAAAKPHGAQQTAPPSAAASSPQPSGAKPEQPTAPEAPTPSAADEAQPSAAKPERPTAPEAPTPSAAEEARPPSAATPAGPARVETAPPARAPKRAPNPTPSAARTSEPPPPPAPEPESTPAITPPPSAAGPTAPAAHPPESAELTLFRRAQKLHLAHSPDALGAWDAYLRVAKHGTLVPEARYNRALCLVWLRRYGEARAALAPFAAGTFEGYRQSEAKALLARIPE